MPRLLAWSVHLFTASGAVLGTLALWEIGRGGFDRASLYLLAAMAIDAVDGTFARRLRVTERVPRIDGRRLDDVVDFLNFAIAPVVFLLAAGALLHWSLAAVPVLASAYGFSQVDAKTEDDFFLGWPSYWNVVAIYVWLLELTPPVSTLWVVGLSALVFVPFKYIYPSKLRRFRTSMVVGGTLWMWLLAFVIWFPEPMARWHATEISLVYPAVYVALSAWLGSWWHPGSTS